jgi:hypothetical protein
MTAALAVTSPIETAPWAGGGPVVVVGGGGVGGVGVGVGVVVIGGGW